MSMELIKALFECKKEIPIIEKRSTAKVRMKSGGEFSYKYADLADVQAAIKEPLEKHGLVITHLIESIDGIERLTTRIFNARVQDLNGFGSSMVLPQGSMQEKGASITYAKRFNIGALLDLCLDEDVDGPPKEEEAKKKVETPKPPQQSPQAIITMAQINRLWAIANKFRWSDEKVHEFIKSRFKIDSVKRLTRFNYDFLISAIEQTK